MLHSCYLIVSYKIFFSLVSGTRQRAKSRLLNNNAVRIMSEWYQQHMDHPYPTEEEKHQMAAAGNIGVPQVKNPTARTVYATFTTWFILIKGASQRLIKHKKILVMDPPLKKTPKIMMINVIS